MVRVSFGTALVASIVLVYVTIIAILSSSRYVCYCKVEFVCTAYYIYAVPLKIRFTIDAIIFLSFEDSVSVCTLLSYTIFYFDELNQDNHLSPTPFQL